MSLVDSVTGDIRREYDVEDLVRLAPKLRARMLTVLHAAGSGHTGGNLSVLDLGSSLILRHANIDPANPGWDGRDRIIPGGHKCVAPYVVYAEAGCWDLEEVATLRKLGSRFQGHPDWKKLPQFEFSAGSLGQGLSLAWGVAKDLKDKGADARAFCIMGDGEQQEGQVFEAIDSAVHFGLDNLVAIIDNNGLQIDGWTKDVMGVEPLGEKYAAHGWDVILRDGSYLDGHNYGQIDWALNEAGRLRGNGKPKVIIAKTVKGKGFREAENQVGWHGKAPDWEELERAWGELGVTDRTPYIRLLDRAKEFQKGVDKHIAEITPRFPSGVNYDWDIINGKVKVEMKPTRGGFGQALKEHGDDERIRCIGCDISGSINIADFLDGHPERKDRFISVGIKEADATNLAAALAKEGRLPIVGTYGVFMSGRNLDQMRTTVCYGNHNVLFAISHCGVSVGPDGATHETLEYLFNLQGLPNMTVVVPSDFNETAKATRALLFDHVGPKSIAYAREATPIVTREDTPFEIGVSNVYRYRQREGAFVDLFDITPSDQYVNEDEDLTIVSCGPELAESLKAAYILEHEYGKDARVINLHSVIPLSAYDRLALVRAARETGAVLTAEEHQVGGFGDIVGRALLTSGRLARGDYVFDMLGVQDKDGRPRFGESGKPWELIYKFGLSGEHIAERAKALLERK